MNKAMMFRIRNGAGPMRCWHYCPGGRHRMLDHEPSEAACQDFETDLEAGLVECLKCGGLTDDKYSGES